MTVVGIDLGTTNSSIAITPNGVSELSRGEDDSGEMPSVVSFPPQGGVLVGQAALDRKIIDSRNTIVSIKRKLGQGALSKTTAAAERAKIRFCGRNVCEVAIDEITYGQGGRPLDLKVCIPRLVFNDKVANLVHRSFAVCDEALHLDKLTVSDISALVMVVGASNIPLIRKMASAYFQREPGELGAPDETVVLGSAYWGYAKRLMYGGSLSSGVTENPSGSRSTKAATRAEIGPTANERNSHTPEIGTVSGYCKHLIPRNTSIPHLSNRVFVTSRDYQSVIRIKVYQGNSRIACENALVGELVLSGTPSIKRGKTRVEISFHLSGDGRLEVSAVNLLTHIKQKVVFESVLSAHKKCTVEPRQILRIIGN